jgi:hypothetical protein
METVFVFYLRAEDGAAVLEGQAVDLPADLVEEQLNEVEIGGVVGAGVGELDEPIGEAAVADFAVRPGTDANPNVHVMPGAQLDKAAEVALAGPVELALHLFMVNPEDVGGDDVDARRLHLEDLVFPLRWRIAREVELAHDGKPGLAVEHEIAAVHLEGVAIRGCATHVKVAGLRWGDGGRRVDVDLVRIRLCRLLCEHAGRRYGEGEGQQAGSGAARDHGN